MRNENQTPKLLRIHFPNSTLRFGKGLTITIKYGIQSILEFAKYCYLVIVEIITICNNNIFPRIDAPIGNAYFEGKNLLNKMCYN